MPASLICTIVERLQVLQEVIEQGHAEIQRRQEHQLEVTEQRLADIQRVGETIQDQLQGNLLL